VTPTPAARRLAEYADETRRLKTDLAEQKAIIDVRDVELQHLSEVIARDRARTRAETAIANMQAAGAGAAPASRVAGG
jgi:hypothetical protein